MSNDSFWNRLPQPIIGLAPMDGVTDPPFRTITARHGRPDLIFTEFVSVDRILSGYDPDLTEFRYDEIERPVIAQIFGIDPEAFYRVAQIVCELGFDGIDINMGCPSKTIAWRGAGAGLIRTPERAREILRRTREGVLDWAAGQAIDRIGLLPSVAEDVRRAKVRWFGGAEPETVRERRPIPVSVKTRLGVDQIIIDDWIPVLLSESPAAITLHGRTLFQGYPTQANWEAIGRTVEIAKGTGTLILGNGDIRSADLAVQRIRETGVHGVLIGRGALGNPWIFRAAEAIRSAVKSDGFLPDLAAPSTAEKFAVILEHAKLYERYRAKRSFRNMRKFLSAYCSGFRGAAELRRRLVRTDHLHEVEEILQPLACA